MEGWERLMDAATRTTEATMQRALRLEEHRRRTQERCTDLGVEQLRDSEEEFQHVARLAGEGLYNVDLWPEPEEELDEEPAECMNCGAYAETVDGIHFVCEACGDEWDIVGGG